MCMWLAKYSECSLLNINILCGMLHLCVSIKLSMSVRTGVTSNISPWVSGKAGHGQDADTNSDPMRIESIVVCVCSVLHFVTLL